MTIFYNFLCRYKIIYRFKEVCRINRFSQKIKRIRFQNANENFQRGEKLNKVKILVTKF